MKKQWAVYTAMCTQLMDSSPAGYTHQHMHGVLHQSNGGRSGDDQPQRTTLRRVWSEPHQGLKKLKKRGETNFTISGNFKRRGRSAKWGVLDFLPEGARPRGHSGKEVPIQSSFDQEHSRRIDSSD